MENITGSLIRSEIKKQGRTSKWVGEQIGLSESTMSQRLSGISNFTYPEIRKIKEILSLPGDWLGVSEEQELAILELFYNGNEDIDVIAEQVNASFEQVSGVIIYDLNSNLKTRNNEN